MVMTMIKVLVIYRWSEQCQIQGPTVWAAAGLQMSWKIFCVHIPINLYISLQCGSVV